MKCNYADVIIFAKYVEEKKKELGTEEEPLDELTFE